MKIAFQNIDQTKRQRIIEACIDEFALKGYEKASTNSIVKKAEISKGALFNYFENKKTLFLYIFDYCVQYLVRKYNSVKHMQPKDLFERFIWLSLLKVKIFSEEPMISRLVVSAVTSMPEDIKEDIAERYKYLQKQLLPEVLNEIDTVNFREGIDPEKAVGLVALFLDGLSDKYLKSFKDQPADNIFNNMNEIIKEFEDYLDILKYGIYDKKNNEH